MKYKILISFVLFFAIIALVYYVQFGSGKTVYSANVYNLDGTKENKKLKRVELNEINMDQKYYAKFEGNNYVQLRLIGKSGDVMKLTDGKLYVNDQEKYASTLIDSNFINENQFTICPQDGELKVTGDCVAALYLTPNGELRLQNYVDGTQSGYKATTELYEI